MSNFLANLFNNVAVALGKVQSIEDIALKDMSLVEAGVSMYEAGKPVVLGPISEGGHLGNVVAVMSGGEASKSLGLG